MIIKILYRGEQEKNNGKSNQRKEKKGKQKKGGGRRRGRRRGEEGKKKNKTTATKMMMRKKNGTSEPTDINNEPPQNAESNKLALSSCSFCLCCHRQIHLEPGLDGVPESLDGFFGRAGCGRAPLATRMIENALFVWPREWEKKKKEEKRRKTGGGLGG